MGGSIHNFYTSREAVIENTAFLASEEEPEPEERTAAVRGREAEKSLEVQLNDEGISASEISPELVTGYRGIYNRFVKRGIDFVMALLLLVVTSPVLLVVSVLVVADSGFPVFYRAERGGYHQKTFRIFKFRTMVQDADKIGGGTTALNDSRITKIGAFLRKTKLDEFANLFSILAGNMSFVGPRPELLQYTSQYEGTETLIHEVRPGITDYSSLEFISLDEIVGGSDADRMYETHVLPRKNKLRVKYAATVSFSTDCRLFFLTVEKVLQKAVNVVLRKGQKERKKQRERKSGVHNLTEF